MGNCIFFGWTAYLTTKKEDGIDRQRKVKLKKLKDLQRDNEEEDIATDNLTV